MEHIVNFGIVVNDEDIAKQVTDMLTRKIGEDIEKEYFKRDYYREVPCIADGIMEKEIKDFVKENSHFIINAVVEKVTEKLYRSKQFKDVIEKIKEEEK